MFIEPELVKTLQPFDPLIASRQARLLDNGAKVTGLGP